MKNNIVPCSEKRWKGNPPPTLRQLGVDRIVNRRIDQWNPYIGTYGMGGPGFFGLHLEKFESYPKEWLVLTLWCADEWLLLDGRWVSAHPNQQHIQQSWYTSTAGPEDMADFRSKVVGTTIKDAKVSDYSSLISLQHGDDKYLLELPEDTTRLPIYGGSLEQRDWNREESHLDAWVVSISGDLRC